MSGAISPAPVSVNRRSPSGFQHGAKAAFARRAIAARPHNAAEAAAQKAKQRRHRDYARLRAAGKAAPPLKESPSRHAQRRAREDRAEHRVAVLQGRAMPDGERLFREHHERNERPPAPAAPLRVLEPGT